LKKIKTFAINVASNDFRRDHVLKQVEISGLNIQIFDAITPVTLDEAQLKYNEQNARRFSGRGMLPTEKACALSHITLWRQLQQDKEADHYVILEDDITIETNIADLLGAIDMADIHFLKLTGKQNRPKKKVQSIKLSSRRHEERDSATSSHSGDPEKGIGEASASSSLDPASASFDADASQRLRDDNTVYNLYRLAYGPLDTAGYVISKHGAAVLEKYCEKLFTPIDIMMDRSYDHGITVHCILPYPITADFCFDQNSPFYSSIGDRKKYADDITPHEKLMVKAHRLWGSVKRHLATVQLHLLKD
jgi:glycosyl transferase family 25